MKRFDFNNAVGQFAPVLDPDHPAFDNSAETTRALILSMPDLPAYLAAYFEQPPIISAFFHALFAKKLPAKNFTGIYRRYASGDPAADKIAKPDNGILAKTDNFKEFPEYPVRNKRVYPLTKTEAVEAMKFAHKNPDFYLTMAAIRNALNDYMIVLKNKVEKTYPNSPHHGHNHEFSVFYHNLNKGFNTPALTHDLMPVLAHTIKNHADPFSPAAMRQAFGEAFRRQIFKSVDQSDDDVYNYDRCPFSQPLIKALSITLEKDQNGNLTAIPTPNPGALIISLRARLHEQHPLLFGKLKEPEINHHLDH